MCIYYIYIFYFLISSIDMYIRTYIVPPHINALIKLTFYWISLDYYTSTHICAYMYV